MLCCTKTQVHVFILTLKASYALNVKNKQRMKLGKLQFWFPDVKDMLQRLLAPCCQGN